MIKKTEEKKVEKLMLNKKVIKDLEASKASQIKGGLTKRQRDGWSLSMAR
jgi:hypothetical protein